MVSIKLRLAQVVPTPTKSRPSRDLLIARSAGRYIRAERPDFAFVYLGPVDQAGHAHGWMSPRYLHQMGHLDEALAELVLSLPPASNLQ